MYSKNHPSSIVRKGLTILVLTIFVLSIVPFGNTAEKMNPGKVILSAEDILAQNLLLTIKLTELDIPPEEKVEILGNALGWEFPSPKVEEGELDAITSATRRVCNQYLQAALLLDTIDLFIPPLTLITGFFYLAAVLCYLGVI